MNTVWSKEQIEKQLEKNNKAFAKLSRNEQRVEICKDVLALLDAKKLVANRGDYWRELEGYNLDQATIVQESQAKQCHVCALGSLFVATSAKVSTGSITDAYNGIRSQMWKGLAKYFDHNELIDIEWLFENEFFFTDRAQLSEENILRCIMKYIIKHQGAFHMDGCAEFIRWTLR